MCRVLLLHKITLSHTHTHILCRAPLDEGTASRRDLYLTTHNIHNRQTSMIPRVFEPGMPSSRPTPQTARQTLSAPLTIRKGKSELEEAKMWTLACG